MHLRWIEVTRSSSCGASFDARGSGVELLPFGPVHASGGLVVQTPNKLPALHETSFRRSTLVTHLAVTCFRFRDSKNTAILLPPDKHVGLADRNQCKGEPQPGCAGLLAYEDLAHPHASSKTLNHHQVLSARLRKK